MRYIYFSLGLMTITILEEPSTEYGDLIGTSTAWHKATPKTKKFILASLINNSEYSGLTHLKIDDCDDPKPNQEEEPS